MVIEKVAQAEREGEPDVDRVSEIVDVPDMAPDELRVTWTPVGDVDEDTEGEGDQDEQAVCERETVGEPDCEKDRVAPREGSVAVGDADRLMDDDAEIEGDPVDEGEASGETVSDAELEGDVPPLRINRRRERAKSPRP